MKGNAVQNVLRTATIVVLVALGTLQTRTATASTNIVQHVTFQITGYEQGPTNTFNTNVTIVSVETFKITTKTIIALIGQAIPTNFSSKAFLVYVTKVNANTNINGWEIRDPASSNRVDVSSFFTGTGRNTNDLVRSLVTLKKLGLSTGVGYSTYHLAISNVPPATLGANGFAVAKHATIHDHLTGETLGVDTVTADIAGTGTDTNGTPFVATGTVNVTGSTVETR